MCTIGLVLNSEADVGSVKRGLPDSSVDTDGVANSITIAAECGGPTMLMSTRAI